MNKVRISKDTENVSKQQAEILKLKNTKTEKNMTEGSPAD